MERAPRPASSPRAAAVAVQFRSRRASGGPCGYLYDRHQPVVALLVSLLENIGKMGKQAHSLHQRLTVFCSGKKYHYCEKTLPEAWKILPERPEECHGGRGAPLRRG